MFNIDKLKKTAAAMIGALVFSTTFVTAAVGPANAVEAGPIASSRASA